MTAPVRELHLHIDRLVLRGLPRVQGEALAAALRDELQSQLSLPGVAARVAVAPARARLQPGAPLPAAADAQALGSAAARRIVEGL